ncbi:MAG: metallophosphoesterase [Planctomycetes bacterium]|nr:metallophosphoesterase [Planctomycetota bacterium]
MHFMSTSLPTKIQGPVAVIGDVHGQVDKLAIILDKLKALPDYEDRWIVLIGDLVDRGPDPRGAVDLLCQTVRDHQRTTAIAGNHEFAMCASLGWFPTQDSAFWGDRWVEYYNSESTFASYGAEIGNLIDLNARVSAEHRDLLTNLPWCVEHPQLLFVHAGLDPNSPFSVQLQILRQRDFSLNRPQWLCERAFVAADPPADCPFVVVSGHVRVSEVVLKPKRILVDTTGGDSGDLSCVLMPERKVISSGPSNPSARPARTSPDRAGKPAWWNLWG